MLFTLKKSFEFEGKKIESLEIDLESLSASDFKRAVDIARSTGCKANNSIQAVLEPEYAIAVAHLATKQPVELFNSMGLADYQRLVIEVAGFLNG